MDILVFFVILVDKGECFGGFMLSLFYDRSFSYIGDSQVQELCLYLIKVVSVFYFEVLEKWIYRGIIYDLYSEFMVEEYELWKERIQEDYNDKYWDQWYIIVQQQILFFLQKMVDKIFSIGKYLNVVRECGYDVICLVVKEIIYMLKEWVYVEQIEKVFNYVSKVLLDFLMEEKELVVYFRFIKCYFFMDQGDFFVYFMDFVEEEFWKLVEDIMFFCLEVFLELVLCMSMVNIDFFKDDFKIDLMFYDFIIQFLCVLVIEIKQEKVMVYVDFMELVLSGLEVFFFDYIVKWFFLFIINRKVFICYQMFFRYMFYCKYVEWQFCSVWISNKIVKQYLLYFVQWFVGVFILWQ